MDLTLITALADASKEKAIAGENILRAINALTECAWRTPSAFYAQLGTDAVAEAQRHRSLIASLQAVAPELVARITFPPFEVIYLADGSAVPTTIPFDPSRQTLVAADADAAAALEAEILAQLEAE